MKKIPLVLIAGFLGAGKTTFLQELLTALKRWNVPASVVINDFENAEVDAARLRHTAGMVVETVSGACVCCSSLEEFLGKLATIEVAEGGVLLVEANGTSDYITLIAALTARAEAGRFISPLQVTMIDASRWQNRYWHNKLECEQVQTSTHWCLRHHGKAAKKRLLSVRKQVTKLAPKAVETDADYFAQYLSLLCTFSTPEEAPQPVGRLESHSDFGDEDDDGDTSSPSHRPHVHHHVHHHHDELAFTSMMVTLPEVVETRDLKRVLDGLPESVLRVKGICRLAAYPGMVFSIQHLRPEVETWCEPVGEVEIEPTCIIIGVGMPAHEIRAEFQAIPLARMQDDPLDRTRALPEIVSSAQHGADAWT
ncbi:GTP-binding protein [Verrucomicrobium spinosum]|uniref:GTP-binding protein n=1 Tax=Verrucomicrobium spinosum TaxID=2736 RepID=UPI0001745DFA|nr:GTP-binding protein [Verrucomicrobium spinosum]